MKNNQILLLAGVIVLITVVSFGLTNPTGKVIKKDSPTTISVTPTTLKQGSVLLIKVMPGSKGAETKVTLYKKNGLRVGEQKEYCNNYVGRSCMCDKECEKNKGYTVKYSSTILSPGEYYASVIDRLTEEKVKTPFIITENTKYTR